MVLMSQTRSFSGAGSGATFVEKGGSTQSHAQSHFMALSMTVGGGGVGKGVAGKDGMFGGMRRG